MLDHANFRQWNTLGFPAFRHRKRLITVNFDYLKHGNLGNAAHFVERAPRSHIDEPFVGHVLEQSLQRNLLIPTQPEFSSNLALASGYIALLYESKDLLARWQAIVVGALFMRHSVCPAYQYSLDRRFARKEASAIGRRRGSRRIAYRYFERF